MSTKTAPLVRVGDDATKAEIAEALTYLAARAARLPHHRDCTQWLKLHECIDDLLTDWQVTEA